MEDLYEILESDMESSREVLKRNYQKLALRYHPDKNVETKEDKCRATDCPDQDMFVKINHAWKILGDEGLRREYDVRWKQRCVLQNWPIQDNVNISDFEENGDDLFFFQCRCGGLYTLTLTDVQLCMDLVCCDTCSLTISVKYDD